MDQERQSAIEAYRNHIYPGKVEFYEKYDILLVPGDREGCRISDMNKKAFFNCHCNGGVFNLGHRNPDIIKAVTEAMASYDMGNHHLVSRPKALLGELLSRTMPFGLNQVVYGVSGGEAVDLAIKLARGVTGRAEIISAQGGYHGHTGFALATGDARFKEQFGPDLPGFSQVPFNDIKAMAQAVGEETAGVILETIPATLGIVVPEPGYLKQVKALCRKAGALLILDEVQTGFGRTGKFWGFENHEVTPDIVVLGKGMGGGIYPVSATVFHEDHKGFFMKDPFIHISTCGGSEIGCMAAMKVIEITMERGFLDHVKDLARYFKHSFGELGEKYPDLGLKLRGEGLMMGLEFKDETTALMLVKVLFDNGIYVVYAGNDPKIIQFLPVLNIGFEDAEKIMAVMDASFKAMQA